MCWDELTFVSSEGGSRALHWLGWKNNEFGKHSEEKW